MVDPLASLMSFAAPVGRLLADDSGQAQPLLVRLDPASRAKVLMSLLALVLLGVALMALAWFGARYLRRIARTPPRPTRPHEDDWYRKRLNDPLADPEKSDN
jgi:hypothetical protein